MPAIHRMAVFYWQIYLKYFLFTETMMNFSEELSFNQKIITEARPFEAPVLTQLKLKSVKILGLAAA